MLTGVRDEVRVGAWQCVWTRVDEDAWERLRTKLWEPVWSAIGGPIRQQTEQEFYEPASRR